MNIHSECPAATDGAIAAINLESARRHAWSRFVRNPCASGAAEVVIEHEHLAAQFLGDFDALNRMDVLASQFAKADSSFRAGLVQAKVASAVHRFADARGHVAKAATIGAPREEIVRQSLTIDQACGVDLESVVAARRKIAAATGRLEDMLPLGAVLADLEYFDEADNVYQRALYSYDDVSPFPLAWICFQLGMLWGELVDVPDPNLAARWYRRAIAYLPVYVKARVHLAEICMSQDEFKSAEALLVPVAHSCDPEIRWRLGNVLISQGRAEEGERHVDAARHSYEELLERHLLAADHAAEFYAGSGNNYERALDLARLNVANRPTQRAVDQLEAIIANARGSTPKLNMAYGVLAQ